MIFCLRHSFACPPQHSLLAALATHIDQISQGAAAGPKEGIQDTQWHPHSPTLLSVSVTGKVRSAWPLPQSFAL